LSKLKIYGGSPKILDEIIAYYTLSGGCFAKIYFNKVNDHI